METNEIMNLSSDYLTRVAIQSNIESIKLLISNDILSQERLTELVKGVESDNNNVPKGYLMKEALQEMRENHNLTIQTALAERMEKVANVIAPQANATHDMMEKLERDYERAFENGRVEEATRLFNHMEELESGSLPATEEPHMNRMEASEVVSRGVSFVTEYLNNFPDESLAIHEKLSRMQ